MKPIVITAGEPAGIGPDLVLSLTGTAWSRPLIVVADPKQLEMRARQLGVKVDLELYGGGSTSRADISLLPIELAAPAVCGEPDPANAAALLQGLRRAVGGCLDGEFAALVTGPLQKSTINDAGIPFSGHTEFIAALTGTETPVMLLVADTLRVALVSTHLPLREVPDYITEARIVDVVRTTDHELRHRFGIAAPRIVVCGLNPHAGEGGHLGHEDDAVIRPATALLRQAGIDAVGPLPADTAFTPAAGHADAVVAMYHDQGLPVLKHAGFGNAVNVTLGLPIVRTSVDHGTALDIAGSGTADAGSFHTAIRLADKMASRA